MADVRDVAAVRAAIMEPGRGPRRYMITGHYIALPDLVAMLQQITGRRGRIVATPAGMTLAVGRVADLMQRLLPGRLRRLKDRQRTRHHRTRPAGDPRGHGAVADRPGLPA
jgi:dihydroflavonol-4-reductase